MFIPKIAKAATATRMKKEGDAFAVRTRWLHFMGRIKPWLNLSQRPTKPELQLTKLLFPLGFTYTGDRSFWIGPCQSGMRRNPDFVWRSGKRKVALLFNGKYWHDGGTKDATEMADYIGEGWRLCIITEEMLQDPEGVVAMVGLWLAGLGLRP